MASEVFVNVGESTLAVAALSTDTTLTLLSGAPFPSAGQYRVRLDDSLQQPGGIATRYEICRATFNAGNVINGFRTGVDLEGTTSQGWPIGTAVRAIVTAAALKTYTSGGPYKARAHCGGTQSISNGADNHINLNVADYDPNGNFSITTGLYTASVTGYYECSWVAVWSSATAGAPLQAKLMVNGAAYPLLAQGITAGWQVSSGLSDVVHLNAGDTVGLTVWQSSGAALNTNGPTALTIHYLSS